MTNNKIHSYEIDDIKLQLKKDLFYLKNHINSVRMKIEGATSEIQKLKNCYKHILLSKFVQSEYDKAVKSMINKIQEVEKNYPNSSSGL